MLQSPRIPEGSGVCVSVSPPPYLLRSSPTALRLPRARGLRFLRLRQRAPGCCFRRQMGDIAALRRVELEPRPPLPDPPIPLHIRDPSLPFLPVLGRPGPSPAPRCTWPPADPAGGGAGRRAAHTALSGVWPGRGDRRPSAEPEPAERHHAGGASRAACGAGSQPRARLPGQAVGAGGRPEHRPPDPLEPGEVWGGPSRPQWDSGFLQSQ